MGEQRLVDGNDLFGIVSLLYDSARRTSRECEYFVGQILFDIKQQPTIEAVPVVHGKWISHMEPDLDWVKYEQECSVCRERIRGVCGTNFCPNCGARMGGDRE